MATTPATWNATTGNWFVAGNWNEPNPNPPPPLVHHVPGASEDVSIPNNSGASTPFTVSYDGTDTVNTLAGDVTGTLDVTGGSLTLANGGANNSMAIDVGDGAKLSVAAGTLNITAGTYSGALAGNGTIQFLFGSFNLDAGVSVTVADWVLGVTLNGTVSRTNLDTNLTYAGHFTLADFSGNHAVLELNSHMLTLSGAATFDGTIHGPGMVLVTGSSVHGSGGYGAPVVYGGAVLEYAAGSTAVQHANTSLGDQASQTTGTVKIDAGATYTIDQSSSLGSSGATYAIVNNAGTLKVSGASGMSATINAHFTNTGTFTVGSDNTVSLGLGAGGVVNTLGGSIGGAGTLVLGGTTTLNTSNVTVGALQLNGGNGGALLTLGNDLSYGGAFSFANQFDTLDLNGHSLTLSGASNSLMGNVIDGAGTLKVTGAASIGSNINIGGPNGSGTAATIEDAGAMTQVGNVGLNGTLLIDAGHGYTITTAGNISSLGASGATVTNKGTFTDSAAGTSTIIGTFTNTGTLAIANGATLALSSGAETVGKVSGAGTLVFGFGSNATINSSDVTVSALALNGGNGGALVTLGTDLTYAGAFSFANQFDTLDLNGHSLTLSGASNSLMGNVIDGAGTLKVTGAASIGGNINIGGPNGSGTAATIEDAGAMTQVGNVGLNGTLLIDAGHGYTITTAGNISSLGASGATVTNKGTFTDSAAGTSTIIGTFTNTGTLAIANGATLALSSGVETVGKVSGAGTLLFGFGSNATVNSSNVSVSALTFSGGNGGALVTLGTDLTYGGAFNFAGQFDTLALNGHQLTLSGNTAFTGGTITGKDGAVDRFTVNGANTNLSNLHFSSWEATDQIALNGTSGNDILVGSSLGDYLYGGAGNDTMAGGAGSDYLYGEDGNDTLIGGAASAGSTNQLWGGAGIDTASYAGTTGTVYADLGALAGYVNGTLVDQMNSIENLTGGSGTNTLVGDGSANVLTGGAGADYLYGQAGDDTLIGGAAPAGSTNQLWGGTGIDTASYVGTTGTVYADLTALAGYVNGTLVDQMNSIENLTGGSGANTLVGDGGANVLTGGAGADYLYGQAGDDTLIGGAAPAGSTNQLWGGTGNDTASYAGTTGNVYADLGAQAGYVNGVLVDQMNSIENLTGGSKADTLLGDAGNNVLTGAGGGDVLWGEGGANRFVYTGYADSNLVSGYDTIADFQRGTDKVDFSALHSSASHLVIQTSGTSNSVYLEQVAGSFNPGTDLALNVTTTTAGGLHASDFIF